MIHYRHLENIVDAVLALLYEMTGEGPHGIMTLVRPTTKLKLTLHCRCTSTKWI
jgi:hypothetical protein